MKLHYQNWSCIIKFLQFAHKIMEIPSSSTKMSDLLLAVERASNPETQESMLLLEPCQFVSHWWSLRRVFAGNAAYSYILTYEKTLYTVTTTKSEVVTKKMTRPSRNKKLWPSHHKRLHLLTVTPFWRHRNSSAWASPAPHFLILPCLKSSKERELQH